MYTATKEMGNFFITSSFMEAKKLNTGHGKDKISIRIVAVQFVSLC